MHGSKDLKPGTFRGILHDLGLTVEDFIPKLNPTAGVRRAHANSFVESRRSGTVRP
jgi:hypothetical protein